MHLIHGHGCCQWIGCQWPPWQAAEKPAELSMVRCGSTTPACFQATVVPQPAPCCTSWITTVLLPHNSTPSGRRGTGQPCSSTHSSKARQALNPTLPQASRDCPGPHLGLVVGAEHGGHEVGQRVVAKVGGHVANPEPLAGPQRHRGGVLQGRHAHALGCQGAVLCIPAAAAQASGHGCSAAQAQQ